MIRRQKKVRLVIGTMVCAMLLSYVSGYVTLRNRGLQEMPQLGVEDFLYDSVERALETQDMSRHYFLAKFFAPMNFIDRTYFNGKGPILCILFELS